MAWSTTPASRLRVPWGHPSTDQFWRQLEVNLIGPLIVTKRFYRCLAVIWKEKECPEEL